MEKILTAKINGIGMSDTEIIDAILESRGIEDIGEFLKPSSDALIPFEEMKGLEEAYQIIDDAITMDEKFLVLADVDADEVDAAMGVYENSEKSAKDLFAFVEQLEKVGVKESAISNIAGSYVKRNLKEGVNVFDTKLGKVVATFAERVDADNYIAESGNEVRFTKRFFG